MSRRLILLLMVWGALLAWCADAALAARFPARIDVGNPFNARTMRTLGAAANESAGSALAGGDFNGDGFGDLVVGAPTALNGRGITYVVFGAANFAAKDSLDLALGSAGAVRILGKNVLDWSGYTVATGNLNGDAYADIIIGAYRADPGGRINAGEVYVIFGSASLASRGTIDLSGSPSGVLRILGKSPEDGFGISLASGRVNGDACDDLIAGAHRADPSGREDAGQAYIIYGAANLANRGTIDLSSATLSGVTAIYGETAGDLAGTSVGAGDFNGDGFADVAVGGTGALGGRGSVCVVPGSAGISARSAVDLASPAEQPVKIYGVSAGEGWGSSVRTGNLNGDGFSDLIMGAPFRDSLYRNDSGEIAVNFGEADFWDLGTVYLGPEPVFNTIRIFGADVGEQAGTVLAVGDANHDGRDDLIVGAPLASPEGRIESGAVYILSGAANLALKGTVDLADTAQVVSRLAGPLAGGHAGAAVCSTDLNGDTFKDIVLGVPRANPVDRSEAGEVYTVFGFGAPAILSYRPTGTRAMSPGSDIALFFNSDMASIQMEVYDSRSTRNPDSLSTSGASVVFQPPRPFVPGGQVRVTVDGTDRDGQAMPRKIWLFDIKTDEIPPRFLSIVPEAGETLVSPAQNVVVTFNPDIAPDSTRVTVKGAGDRVITMARSWVDSTLTLTNNNSFRRNETITVTVSAADRYGDRADSTWIFTTRPETVPPTPVAQVPGIPLLLPKNSWFRLAFPYDVDKSTVDAALSGSLSGDIAGTWTWADSSYTFTPAHDLRPGETLLLTVDAEDIHRNAVTGWTAAFKVKPDEVPPTIIEYAPGASERNVSPASPITIKFSSDVNRDSTTVTVTSKASGALSMTKTWVDYTLTLQKGAAFTLSDSITVSVKAGDSYANRSAYSWGFSVRPEMSPPTFSIAAPPRRDLITPSDSITVAFSSDVDTTRVSAVLKGRFNEILPGSWRWSNTRYTFQPSAPYPSGYILFLTLKAVDIHGNAMPDTTVTFTVRPESEPPAVRSHLPAAYAANVPVSSSLTIRFNSDVFPDSTTVTLRSNRRSSIGYARSWTDSTLTLTPSSQFQSDEAVTVTVSASDRYGNRKPYAWTFYTGAWVPPYVPAVPLDPASLLPATPISVRVGKTTDRATVSASITGSLSGAVAGSWAWADTVYTFTPSPGYRLGETLTLRVQARDIYGNAIPEYTRAFQVRVDASAPSILSRTPAPDAVNEHPAQDIVITFSGDAVRDSTTVQVRGAQNRTITCTLSWRDSTLTVHHAESFRLGEKIAVTVRTGDGYSNRAEYPWSFTVRPEIVPPAFRTVTPRDPQLLLPGDSITLMFPGDVDHAAVSAALTGSLGGAVAGNWAWTDSLYTFTPSPGYRPGDQMTLTVNAADIHRNAIPETVLKFRARGDAVPPAVLSHTPRSGEENVSPAAGIVITFSGDAVPDSTVVQVRGARSGIIPCSPSWRDSTLTLRSGLSLPLGETVTVNVRTGDRDTNHTEYAWNFATRPEIAPPNFQVDAPGDSAALAANIPLTLVFPADVDTARVSALLTGSLSGAVAGAWSWDGVRYTFTPAGLYRPGETLTLRVNAVDIHGNAIPETVRAYIVGVHTPRLTITGVDFADSTEKAYRVRYRFDDPDGNFTVTRGWQYSLDNGPWVAVPESAISGNTSRAPGSYQILWTVPAAFTGVYSTNVRFRMEVFDGRYGSGSRISPAFGVDRNRPASVAVRSAVPDYAREKLTVGFAITDTESNPVSLRFEYSLDGGVVWKTGTPDRALENIPSTGYTGSFGWNYLEGLRQGIDYYGVLVRLTPADYKPGAPSASSPFRVDLNLPPSVALDDIFATQSGDVPVTFHITDAEGDTVRFACAYSTDDGKTWKPTSHVSGAENITRADGTLVWHSGRDLAAVQSWKVRFRAVPWDHDEGTPGSTGSFQLLNSSPPRIAVTFPDTSGFAVPLPIVISDVEGDPVTLHASWSTDGGTTWKPAALLPDTLNLPSNAGPDTLSWSARSDLGAGFFEHVRLRIMAGDAHNPPDTTGSGYAEGGFAVDNLPPRLVSASGTAERDTVYVSFDEPLDAQTALVSGNYTLSGGLRVGRVAAGTAPGRYMLVLENGQALTGSEISVRAANLRDRFGNPAGPLAASFPPEDGNANPTVDIEALPPSVAGDVTVPFHIRDAEGDPVSLAVSFSRDGGTTWIPATVSGTVSSIDPGGYDGSFVWRSGTDFPGVDAGEVRLRVIPRDSQDGAPAFSGPFRVDNNRAPSVALSLADPDSIRSGAVDISYALLDAEGDTLDLAVSYSIDGGGTFLPAAVSGTLSGLSRDRYAGSLRWNTAADLPDFFGRALVRAEPGDAGPGFADTLAVTIDNYGSCRVALLLPGGECAGDIAVRYSIIDPRSHAVTLRARYSRDNGASWDAATVDGDLDGLGAGAYTGVFTWRASADLAGYEGPALLEVIPNNGRDGAPGQGWVAVDLNAPPAVRPDPMPDEVSDDVAVSFTPTDAERDRVALVLKYSIDNRRTWYDADISGEISGVAADGETHVILWRSGNDLPGRDTDGIWLRLAAADADTGAFAEIGPVHVDNNHPPTVRITAAAPQPSYAEIVEIRHELADSERNMVRFEMFYSTDGGKTYLPASITGKTSSIFPGGYTGTVQWNLAADLPDRAGEAVVKCIPWDTDPGTPDSLVVRFNTVGEFRVALAGPEDVQTSDVTLSYSITDRKGHTLNLRPEYSLSGLEWKPATVSGKTAGLGPGEYAGTLVWNGRADLAGFTGAALFRVIPDLGLEGIPDTVRVTVDYNDPPAVTAVLNDTAALYSGDLNLSFTARDPEGNPFSLEVEYSLDHGATFQPATVSGNTDIPAADPGTVAWSTFRDLGYAHEREVLLRLRPVDGKPGAPVVAGPFHITNLVGDFTHDLRVDGADLPGFIQTWKYRTLAREMGPVAGEPPYLTVNPDGKVDFEDLAGFVWMWNWFSAQVAAKGIPAVPPEAPAGPETGEGALRFTPGLNGGVEVTGAIPLDYLRILAEPGNGARVSFDAGDWWTRDAGGVFLTRSYPGQVCEAAAALLEERSTVDAVAIPLGTLHLDGLPGDVRIRYEYRPLGGDAVLCGTAVIPSSVLAPRPVAVTLFQNSPNPFNPTTVIRFALPRESRARLTVYNLAGQKIATLLDGRRSAGYHSIHWDAAGFPSGVYFYTLSAEGITETRRMTLLK